MCRAKTCCGCCGLDVGVYVVAAFTLLVSAIEIGSVAYYVDMFVKLGVTQGSYFWTMVGLLVFFCLWFVSSILLIIGGVQRKRGFLILWMVITIIVLIIYGLGVILGIIGIALWASLGEPLLKQLSNQGNVDFSALSSAVYIAAIVVVVVIALFFALWVYATVVIFSFNAELRDEELGIDRQQIPMQPGYNPGYNQYNQGYNQAYGKDPYQRV